MSSREEKRAKRLENKKRKIEAFLNIAKLNETDNIKKRKVDHTPENFNQLVNSAENNGNNLDSCCFDFSVIMYKDEIQPKEAKNFIYAFQALTSHN